MTPVVIRPAVEADQDVIQSMVRASPVNPRDIRWSRFLVAVEEGFIVGIQQVRTHKDGTREVATRVVRPEYRRRGIGADLLRVLLDREPGPLYLQCGERGAPYYERFGFRRVKASGLPPDFRREHRIGRIAVAARSLYLRRRPRILPMKRDAWTNRPATRSKSPL